MIKGYDDQRGIIVKKKITSVTIKKRLRRRMKGKEVINEKKKIEKITKELSSFLDEKRRKTDEYKIK